MHIVSYRIYLWLDITSRYSQRARIITVFTQGNCKYLSHALHGYLSGATYRCLAAYVLRLLPFMIHKHHVSYLFYVIYNLISPACFISNITLLMCLRCKSIPGGLRLKKEVYFLYFYRYGWQS